jgi:Mor family transcriptional regulator
VDDLRAAFGGQMLYFPRGGITKDERAEQILDEWRGGRSVGEIAERLRLSVTYVYQMLARGRQNARLRAGAHVSPTTEAKTDGH